MSSILIGGLINTACSEYIENRYKRVAERITIPLDQTQCEQLLTAFYKAEVASRHRQYIDDMETRTHINIASQWLTNSDGKPGLLLYGGIGNGKSTLARAIKSMLNGLKPMGLQSYSWEMVELAAIDVASKKKESIDRMKNVPLLMIDDLGTESPISYSFGTEFYPITEIIYRRYDYQRFTIITSNLSDEKLISRYGRAVWDRIEETYDFIAFENPSYRTI